jgi:hypothetical protein
MPAPRPAKHNYRALIFASLIAGGSFAPVLPAFADQNSPTPGTLIENQATAEFIDAADNATGQVVSDKVTVTVAEVAGISATGSAITNTAYRTNVVYFDFIVKNEGNDPTQLFVPAKPSAATVGGVAIPASNIGQLEVIEYNNTVTSTAISTNNLVDATTGSATGSLSGVPSNGSVPAGGYIKVRVPITVPTDATTGATISVTLGNTSGQPSNTNTPYLQGANGTGTNDLYTQDNADGTGAPAGTTTPESADRPVNGDSANRRQEASATQTTPVVDPPTVTISGTVFDDANGTGTATFTTIQDGTEAGANTTATSATTPLYAVLVDSTGKVLDKQLVNAANGTYSVSTLGVQTGLYVVLTTNSETIGQPLSATAPTLPNNWTATTPLTYAGTNAFPVGITNVTGKHFGIELLPDTANVSQTGIANSPGATKYQVPTLTGSDTDPTTPTTLGSGSTFRIVTIPAAAQGVLYYNNVAVTANQTITNYDPTKLTFDPVDGVVTMSFTYASVDAASKADPTPATATMSFDATPVTLTGKVYNDRNGLTTGTSNNGTTIATNPAGADIGTDAVFGTSQTPVNAVLVNATNGLALQASVVVAADGSYTFSNVPPSTDVKVVLSATAVALGATPTAAAPAGWVATAPTTTGTINTGLYPVTSSTNDIDFGIRQKAKLVLLKRITKINGLTTNPNDGTTVLNGTTTDNHNNLGVGNNWPTNFLFGVTNAGPVKPGDTIEYTIYFMNNQGSDANSVKICDPIKGSQDYMANSMTLQFGNGAAAAQTDIADTADYAHSYTGASPTNCNAANTTAIGAANGGIAIGIPGQDKVLDPILGATGVGTPSQSYGLFRFTTKVKP